MTQTVIVTNGYWMVRCRACGHHLIPADKGWKWNGDLVKPTFTPSVKETCNSTDHSSYNPEAKTSLCHFIVTDGNIAYCGDCLHDLKNQALPLEPWSEEKVAYYAAQAKELNQ